MSSRQKKLPWRVVYAVCCLLYVAWMVHLSFNNFAMVHRDYRRAGERLQPVQVAKIALRELVDQCHQDTLPGDQLRWATVKGAVADEDACLHWPTTVLVQRQEVVTERLLAQRDLAGRKLVLFYGSFGTVFLILPPVLLYLLLSSIAWIFRNLKVVK